MRLQAGTVYLVGAGPGDPGLLTLKAFQCLQQAEIILHDRLVSAEILELAADRAEKISVGKEGGGSCFPQFAIHELLISYARERKKVVRLKGGDPFLFGRGGEEALALHQAGIPFEVIPGVSSALAAPAAAGIPVTHRNLSSQLTIVTGHGQSDGTQINWRQLASLSGTLIVLMPLHNLEKISEELQHGGLLPETPAALIQSGTSNEQKVVISTIHQIAKEARKRQIGSPVLLAVGSVVALSPILFQGCPPPLHFDASDEVGLLSGSRGCLFESRLPHP